MIPVLDSETYAQHMFDLPRPGQEDVLAFYEHRVGAICRDPKLMLIPLDDHLVHRGDGVFETLKYIDGKLYQLDPHIERMQRSSAAIFLEPPCPWEKLRELVLEVARAGEAQQGLVRILLGRGPGGFGIDPNECPEPSLYLVAYALHPKGEDAYERGVTSYRSSIPAKQSYMATIKSIDYLPNMLMKREAQEKGFDFGLCFDDNGFLAEGSTENCCIVDQAGVIHVPTFTNSLAGTTLLRGIELLKGEVETCFCSFSEEEILAAKEFMVVGTTIDALPVVSFNKQPIGDGKPGPVCRRMRELLRADLLENGTPIF